MTKIELTDKKFKLEWRSNEIVRLQDTLENELVKIESELDSIDSKLNELKGQ